MKLKNVYEIFSLKEPEKFDANILGDNTKNKEEAKEDGKSVAIFLEENEKYIKSILSNCSDLIIRPISLFGNKEYKAIIIYLSEFNSTNVIESIVIKKLLDKNKLTIKEIEEHIKYTFGLNDNEVVLKINSCIKEVLNGKIVIFIEMIDKAFILDLKQSLDIPILEPNTETALRGPRESFTETLNTNINLIRRIIKNPKFKIEKETVKGDTNTELAMCYLVGAVDEKVLLEVKSRINRININQIISSNTVLEAIEDDTVTIFPTIFRTERPDVAASKIMEGKVVIIVDGSPIILSIPALFVEFMQSADDYYIEYIPATFNRWLRYIGISISLIFPSLYIALMSFQQELIPTPLAISIIRSRSGVPFPSVWECFFMLFTYDIIREASLRIPKALGNTVSIVGALILGEAAVKAGIVGAPIIIIVAFSGISLFSIPSLELNTAIVVIKYIMLILAAIFGVIGIVNGMLFLAVYMVSRRSFGVPYMYPIAPFNLKRNEDTIIRTPIWKLDKNFKLFKNKR